MTAATGRVDLHLAATITGVQPATIRQWVHRRWITRHPDGSYDLRELTTAATRRNPDALARRASLSGDTYQTVRNAEHRITRLLTEAITSVTLTDTPDTPETRAYLTR